MAKFQKRIFICSLIIAAIVQIVSLFILGINFEFTLGLIVGTGVAIINFFIMSICTEIALEKKRTAISLIGFAGRFILYGTSFALTLIYSYKMGTGCAIGFFTVQLSILYLFAIKPSLKRSKEL